MIKIILILAAIFITLFAFVGVVVIYEFLSEMDQCDEMDQWNEMDEWDEK